MSKHQQKGNKEARKPKRKSPRPPPRPHPRKERVCSANKGSRNSAECGASHVHTINSAGIIDQLRLPMSERSSGTFSSNSGRPPVTTQEIKQGSWV